MRPAADDRPGQTVTAAAGIVLRGVRATDKAKVRDGAQEAFPSPVMICGSWLAICAPAA